MPAGVVVIALLARSVALTTLYACDGKIKPVMRKIASRFVTRVSLEILLLMAVWMMESHAARQCTFLGSL